MTKLKGMIPIAIVVLILQILIVPPVNATQSTLEYQVGTIRWDTGETWSPWVSDGETASVVTNSISTSFMLRMNLPDFHVAYQIGTIRWDTGGTWSPWVSNGETASVARNSISSPLMLRVNSTDYQINYQIGNILWDTGETWSP